MTFVVVGASSGLGRALTEALARRGHGLLLVAGDARDLEPLAADLRITHRVETRTLAHDAADHAGLAAGIEAALGAKEGIDGLLFPIGWSDDADDLTLPAARSEELVRVNFLAVTSVVQRLLPRMLARGRGVIVGFSSVAAERGRGRNAIYAAAKRALASYFESLRHRAEAEGIAVCLYTLGYVDTNLAFGRPLPFPKADPRALAERICDDLGRARGKRFLPSFWRPLSFAVRALPWFVFRRTRF